MGVARVPHRNDLWDDEAWDVLSSGWSSSPASRARSARSPSRSLIRSGMHSVRRRVCCGRLAGRGGGRRSTRRPGQPRAVRGAAAARRPQGREAEARRADRGSAEVTPSGRGQGLIVTQWASAVLHNGLGRYEEALAAARQASEYSYVIWFSTSGTGRADRGGRPERRAGARGRALERLRRERRPAAPTGRWGSRPARARC